MDEKQTSMETGQIKKIVIIGPESTGKSTLCKQLANYYKTQWCPEFAREYLLANGIDYTFDDLETIAKGQLALEENYLSIVNNHSAEQPASSTQHPVSNLLFIDTDMYVMKVWCEYVFGKCHPFVLEEIAKRKYHLYLLCNVDLPWAYDPLREYPDKAPRKELYSIYKDILINQSVPWVEINGGYEERLMTAVNAIDKLVLFS
jgi:NadR type nicotinamide-nucleotide adenylyltransferase